MGNYFSKKKELPPNLNEGFLNLVIYSLSAKNSNKSSDFDNSELFQILRNTILFSETGSQNAPYDVFSIMSLFYLIETDFTDLKDASLDYLLGKKSNQNSTAMTITATISPVPTTEISNASTQNPTAEITIVSGLKEILRNSTPSNVLDFLPKYSLYYKIQFEKDIKIDKDALSSYVYKLVQSQRAFIEPILKYVEKSLLASPPKTDINELNRRFAKYKAKFIGIDNKERFKAIADNVNASKQPSTQ